MIITGLVFFTVIVSQWDFAHGGSSSWPYSVLSVSSADLKAIGIQPPSWVFGSTWSDDRSKSSLEENENEGESSSGIDERLLKHHAWNFIKKLKGKDEEEPKKSKKKKKKNDSGSSGSPLLSIGFLSSIFGEEQAANETTLVDDLSGATSNSSSPTVVPPLLIIDNVSSSDSLPASDETVEIASTTKAPKIKIKKKPVNETTSDENSDEKEDDDGEEDSEEDEEEEEEEEDDEEDDENDDKKNTSDGGDNDPEEIILDSPPKGPDGSDVMEPADIDKLGKKADLYIRLNKAHQSAKQFLGVFKGVYVDYVKNRPHLGIEVGNLGGRAFADSSHSGISRMGRPWRHPARSNRIYRGHNRPKIYFPTFDDYYDYDDLRNSDIYIREYDSPNIMYASRRSIRQGLESVPYDYHVNYYNEHYDYL